jgi:transcriptional regulator with XRE-family HTH domain
MGPKGKRLFTNQLRIVRRRRSIEQKKVAMLLGHKSINMLSRYERGAKLPSLKAALKLGLIYKIPIRVLLDGYYEACRKEIKRLDQSLGKSNVTTTPKITYRPNEADFCTIEEKLRNEHVTGTDLDKAYRHSANLIRQRATKLGHI